MASLEYYYKKTDISPKESVLLAGYANRAGTSKEIHRPLTSRCLILKKEKNQVCIIANDLMEVPPEIVDEIRTEISRKTGMESDHIIIISIHTHSAPLMEYGANEANDRYIKFAVKKIIENSVEVVLEKNLFRVGKVKIGSGSCEIGANRKLIIPESGPAYRISDPAGIRDEEVKILQILDENGNNPVTLFNYACHPVTLGFDSLVVSTDFPGRAREMVENAFGGESIFLNGAAANINPLTEQHTNTQKPDEYGEKLGEAVINAKLVEFDTDTDLNYFSGKIEIPYRDKNITRDFIEREVKRKSRQTTEFYHWQQDLQTWADRILDLYEQGKIRNTFRFEVSVLTFGPALFYFTQGELFVEYQLALKKRFPAFHIFCIGYAHGEGAYIPTAVEYGQQGYETDQAYIYQGLPSPFTRDIENNYLEESVNIIKSVLD